MSTSDIKALFNQNQNQTNAANTANTGSFFTTSNDTSSSYSEKSAYGTHTKESPTSFYKNDIHRLDITSSPDGTHQVSTVPNSHLFINLVFEEKDAEGNVTKSYLPFGIDLGAMFHMAGKSELAIKANNNLEALKMFGISELDPGQSISLSDLPIKISLELKRGEITQSQQSDTKPKSSLFDALKTLKNK